MWSLFLRRLATMSPLRKLRKLRRIVDKNAHLGLGNHCAHDSVLPAAYVTGCLACISRSMTRLRGQRLAFSMNRSNINRVRSQNASKRTRPSKRAFKPAWQQVFGNTIYSLSESLVAAGLLFSFSRIRSNRDFSSASNPRSTG